jgi:predicted enzyme related to lactoylglutathione lyase
MPCSPAEICHINIPAPDQAQAKAFYKKVFAWKCTPMPGMKDYSFWSAGDVSGGFDSSAKPTRRGVTLFMAVADIEATLKKIERAGGKTVRGKIAIPGNMGFMADFLDPAGNLMGLWSSK